MHWAKLPSGVEAWLVARYVDAKQAHGEKREPRDPVKE